MLSLGSSVKERSITDYLAIVWKFAKKIEKRRNEAR